MVTWLGVDWLGVIAIVGAVAAGVVCHRRGWLGCGRDEEALFPEFDAWHQARDHAAPRAPMRVVLGRPMDSEFLDALAEIRSLPETAERWVA